MWSFLGISARPQARGGALQIGIRQRLDGFPLGSLFPLLQGIFSPRHFTQPLPCHVPRLVESNSAEGPDREEPFPPVHPIPENECFAATRIEPHPEAREETIPADIPLVFLFVAFVRWPSL